jgi:hypothetical protein
MHVKPRASVVSDKTSEAMPIQFFASLPFA